MAGVDHLIYEPEFRGRDYVADLAVARAAAAGSARPITERTTLATGSASASSRPSSSTRWTRRVVRPADDLVIVFTLRQPRHAQGRDPHPRRRARRRRSRDSASAASTRGDRLYIPMPFFWVGGLGAGLLSVLVAGATLITERRPEAGARRCACSSASGSRCSAAGPTRPSRIAAHPDFATTDLSRLKPGQPARGAARRDARRARQAVRTSSG